VADAETAELQKQAKLLESEVALWEGAAATSSSPDATEDASGQEATLTVELPGAPECGAEGQEAISIRGEAKNLVLIKQRVDELQRSSDDKNSIIADLEVKCGPASSGASAEGEASAATVSGQTNAADSKDADTPVPDASTPVLDMANPRSFLAARTAQRYIVSTEDAPQLAGEYRQVPGGANGWPAYKAAGSCVAFLLWTPCDGGCWVFAPDLAGTNILARSLQLAWTSLPDEIMAGSWTCSAWGERGARIRIAVLRG